MNTAPPLIALRVTVLTAFALLAAPPLAAQTGAAGLSFTPQPGQPVTGFTHSFRSAFGVTYTGDAAQPVQPGAAGLYTLRFQHTTDTGIGFDFRLQLRSGNFHLSDQPAHGEAPR